MRDDIAEALNRAEKDGDKRRLSTLRLINAAIKDRDVANRSAGRDPVAEDDVQLILCKMVKQRVESARDYEESGQIELAEQERGEIDVIEEFMPRKLDAGAMEVACRKAVADTESKGLRDVGRCMNTLKQRYPDQMDFSKASTLVKGLLR